MISYIPHHIISYHTAAVPRRYIYLYTCLRVCMYYIYLHGAGLDLRLRGIIQHRPLLQLVRADRLLLGAELHLDVQTRLLPDDLALLLVRELHHQRQHQLTLQQYYSSIAPCDRYNTSQASVVCARTAVTCVSCQSPLFGAPSLRLYMYTLDEHTFAGLFAGGVYRNAGFCRFNRRRLG